MTLNQDLNAIHAMAASITTEIKQRVSKLSIVTQLSRAEACQAANGPRSAPLARSFGPLPTGRGGAAFASFAASSRQHGCIGSVGCVDLEKCVSQHLDQGVHPPVGGSGARRLAV